MLAARSRREAKQGLRRGAGVAVHREQEAAARVSRTRGTPGRRRSRAVVRPSTRASHPSRAGCGYSGFLPLPVRLSRLAPAFDRREENRSHRQPIAQRVPVGRPANGDLAAKDVPTKRKPDKHPSRVASMHALLAERACFEVGFEGEAGRPPFGLQPWRSQ